jgi:SAM-dependent methyltransferase
VSTRQTVQRTVNVALRPFGVQIVRNFSADPAVKNYLPAKKTIAAARRAGLGLCDYIEKTNSEAGATQRTVDTVLRIGGITPPVERVCEIGAGTGRYAEKFIESLQPKHYEVYETAVDWLPHLRGLPHVEIKPADGHSLAGTASASVDLAHANKVFVYIPFAAVAGYLLEMLRVTKPGGTIAFDVVTEECMTDQVLESWMTSGTIFIPTPKAWVIDFLGRRGAELKGTMRIQMVEMETELFVFRRT